jgi:hypothetical protein
MRRLPRAREEPKTLPDYPRATVEPSGLTEAGKPFAEQRKAGRR